MIYKYFLNLVEVSESLGLCLSESSTRSKNIKKSWNDSMKRARGRKVRLGSVTHGISTDVVTFRE